MLCHAGEDLAPPRLGDSRMAQVTAESLPPPSLPPEHLWLQRSLALVLPSTPAACPVHPPQVLWAQGDVLVPRTGLLLADFSPCRPTLYLSFYLRAGADMATWRGRRRHTGRWHVWCHAWAEQAVQAPGVLWLRVQASPLQTGP